MQESEQVPPAPGNERDGRMRGSNQASLRAHNERAVLTLIRRHGEIARADIARRSGLSPQTASVIMRVLEAEALVLRETPRRGRVGQPSVPMRLNPDGAFSLGLKIGRRSVELVLMDFVGVVRARRRLAYAYPRLAEILAFVRRAEAEVAATLAPALAGRIAGLGVAIPFDLWSWPDAVGGPVAAMEEWRTVDIVGELAKVTGLSVHMANDATAACAAENVFGATRSADYVYLFVGAFVGGGIVIDGDLVTGRTGNAAALGSMPVPDGEGGVCQLIGVASIHVLEKMIAAEGGDPLAIWRDVGAWDGLGPVLERWLAAAARALAHALVSASAVYDFECAVIDGSFPPAIRARLVAATAREMATLERQGLSPLEIREGTIGAAAREIGAASLPLFARFLLDHRVLYADGGT
ncbi:ROK family transcriptional regulator [Aurantimonas sp. HBX-1]|uniref:ROK family transcriptional regulator n=1 Tax=Aurantimonas sp. HBX-1 TaxID=2906072 RepID=UPI001F3F4BF7|nr:ROK family transcriptional regulator [Aurantimonas sp. HBX-1]UIJ71730.1 ROK family transcriptional regulator [Aurantimonas sp. HBX-1]